MSDLLTPEFAAKVEAFFDMWADAQQLAHELRQHEIGLVDITRHRSWIDERVHEGVLFRLARLRRQQPPRIVVKPETWRGLTP